MRDALPGAGSTGQVTVDLTVGGQAPATTTPATTTTTTVGTVTTLPHTGAPAAMELSGAAALALIGVVTVAAARQSLNWKRVLVRRSGRHRCPPDRR